MEEPLMRPDVKDCVAEGLKLSQHTCTPIYTHEVLYRPPQLRHGSSCCSPTRVPVHERLRDRVAMDFPRGLIRVEEAVCSHGGIREKPAHASLHHRGCATRSTRGTSRAQPMFSLPFAHPPTSTPTISTPSHRGRRAPGRSSSTISSGSMLAPVLHRPVRNSA